MGGGENNRKVPVSVLSSMRKADLKAILVEFFVDEGVLESQVPGPSHYSEEAAVRLKELELQIQIEQRTKAEVELGLAKLKQATTQKHTTAFDPSKHSFSSTISGQRN